MFSIRTIQVVEVKSIKDFVDNFDFSIRYQKTDDNLYSFSVLYIDPISKEVLKVGTINLDSQTFEQLSSTGDFDNALIKMAKSNSSIIEPQF